MLHRLFILVALSPIAAIVADDKVVSYETDIVPIFRQHCFKCHGNDKQKADINLQSYSAMMAGGSGGEILTAGNADDSILFLAMIHDESAAKMPPKSAKLPEAKLALVRKWIEQGIRETATSKAKGPIRERPAFVPNVRAKQDGPPPMPKDLPEADVPKMHRPFPVITLASNPWSPLIATPRQDGIDLHEIVTEDDKKPSLKQLGTLAFSEGEPHVLRFSRDGRLLLAAGGRPVQSGRVVLYEVVTGKRVAEVADELDTIIAADLSPDQTKIAIGGTNRLVKVFSTATGKLLYQMDRHTDWVTALEFSPDGKQLATGDRSGGIHLWDTASGGILLSLSSHKESVNALSWRSDSKILASAGEDGKIIWWDTAGGWAGSTKAGSHTLPRPNGVYGTMPNGVLAVHFGPKGNLLSAGRNLGAILWDIHVKEIKRFMTAPSIPTSVAISHDGNFLICGDASGQIHMHAVK